MKKIFMFICIMYFCSATFAEEYQIGIFKAKTWNYLLKDFVDLTAWISYEQKESQILFYLQHFDTTVVYELDKENSTKLEQYINKYLKWEEKAISLNMRLKKEIGTMNVLAYIHDSKKWLETYGTTTLTFNFFSLNEHRHQLVIIPEDLNVKNGDTHTSKTLCLDLADVKNLQNLISEITIKETIDKIEEQRKIEEKEFK